MLKITELYSGDAPNIRYSVGIQDIHQEFRTQDRRKDSTHLTQNMGFETFVQNMHLS